MNKTHWLYQVQNRKKIWIAGCLVLAINVLLEVFIHLHASFRLTDFFGFNALFGFFSCVAMIVFAKLLGLLIKRRDDYYDS